MKFKMVSVVTSVVQIVIERSQKTLLQKKKKKTCLLPTPHMRKRLQVLKEEQQYVATCTLKTDLHRLKQQQ